MINAKMGDTGDQRAFDHIGRIKPSAQADFDDAGIGLRAGKGQKCRRCCRFEKAGIDPVGLIEHFGQQTGEFAIVNQRSGNPDPFVETHQMRARIDMRLLTGCFDCRAQKGAGRTLSIGPRNMEHRGQGGFRIAEPVEKRGNALQAQRVAPGRKLGKAV